MPSYTADALARRRLARSLGLLLIEPDDEAYGVGDRLVIAQDEAFQSALRAAIERGDEKLPR